MYVDSGLPVRPGVRKMSVMKKLMLISVFPLMLASSSLASGRGVQMLDSSMQKEYEHAGLNGHNFISNSYLGSPFVETFLQNKLGVGQTINLDYPVIRIQGEEILQVKGELIFTTIQIAYQQEIRDWLAVGAKFQLIGRLGNSTGAFISSGVNVLSGYELNWLFNLYKDKKFILSGNVDIVNSAVTIVNMRKFIQGVIDSGRVTPDNRLVESLPLISAGVGISLAYAFNPVFGFTFNGSLRNGESYDRTKSNEWFHNFGFAFDADLLPRQKIPIGFLLGYYETSLPGTEGILESNPRNVVAQINYTGNRDLGLGIELNYQRYKPVTFDEYLNYVNYSLALKYYF